MGKAADMVTVSRGQVLAPLAVHERMAKSPECIDTN